MPLCFYYDLSVVLYEKWFLLIVNRLNHIRVKDAGVVCVTQQRSGLEESVLLVEKCMMDVFPLEAYSKVRL